jgi:uncharacterized protein (TIGR02001 family)
MKNRYWIAGVSVLTAPWIPAAATAQSSTGPQLSIEAASDERRRGISWSDGNPIIAAELSVPVGSAISLRARATSLWSDNRHANADGVIDLTADVEHPLGVSGWTLNAQASYHIFPGTSGQGYGELGASVGTTVGPASLDFFARYAPNQDAIGGNNLYAGASAAVSIPATPLTLSAHVGHSSGNVNDTIRAARLRPGGSYWDHGVALDWYKGRWSAGLRYANSDIEEGPARRNAGATLIARVGLTL